MQNILESLTLAQGNYAGSYVGILRYTVPILSAILLLRCVLPLLTLSLIHISEPTRRS